MATPPLYMVSGAEEQVGHITTSAEGAMPRREAAAVIFLVQVVFLLCGVRDLVMTGLPLPLPHDEKFQAWLLDTPTGESVAFASKRMSSIGAVWGALIVSVALIKMVSARTTDINLSLSIVAGNVVTIYSIMGLEKALAASEVAEGEASVMGLVAVLGIETICWLIPTTTDGGPDASSKQAKKRI